MPVVVSSWSAGLDRPLGCAAEKEGPQNEEGPRRAHPGQEPLLLSFPRQLDTHVPSPEPESHRRLRARSGGLTGSGFWG